MNLFLELPLEISWIPAWSSYESTFVAVFHRRLFENLRS